MTFEILAVVIDLCIVSGVFVGLWANIKDTVGITKELHNDED